MFKKSIQLLFIPILLAAALNSRAQEPAAEKTPSTAVNPLITASNAFAFDLYKQLSEKPGNIFFSPYSIDAALAMTYEGARGLTADEMENVLHLPKNADLRREQAATHWTRGW